MTPRILVTRPPDQAAELCDRLRARGFDPVSVPTVAIDRESAAAELSGALAQLEGTGWLIVTSANGAEAVVDRLAAGNHRIPAGTRLAAVGPATAAVLEGAGLHVDHVPEEYLTVAIADGLGDVSGQRVMLARADAATPQLRDALADAGAEVIEVVAYRTIEGPAHSRDALHVALHGELDGVTFTSSSTVRGLLRLASPTDRQRARAIPAFCIGPVTATTARQLGFDVEAVATVHTAAGLADATAIHLEGAR